MNIDNAHSSEPVNQNFNPHQSSNTGFPDLNKQQLEEPIKQPEMETDAHMSFDLKGIIQTSI